MELRVWRSSSRGRLLSWFVGKSVSYFTEYLVPTRHTNIANFVTIRPADLSMSLISVDNQFVVEMDSRTNLLTEQYQFEEYANIRYVVRCAGKRAF
ncbi:hypothetical protein KIN20_007095 [Parelaphostrongylus tenuis]|uniref:Uncharacterized protein n=1 Tax=Parelaphostrongylus tenuis TaxID=148309 RepID=A0AAD5MLN0_PARTN|nr:hypothetical protein KIN20_007095 [Parelaphostrongylus tenuis]